MLGWSMWRGLTQKTDINCTEFYKFDGDLEEYRKVAEVKRRCDLTLFRMRLLSLSR